MLEVNILKRVLLAALSSISLAVVLTGIASTKELLSHAAPVQKALNTNVSSTFSVSESIKRETSDVTSSAATNFVRSKAVVNAVSLPTEVLSPVVGDLGVTGRGTINNKWEFSQHKLGPNTGNGHAPGQGVLHADDTYAWDINFRIVKEDGKTIVNRDFDIGQDVYAVADGEVVRWGRGGSGEVLIAHPDKNNVKWWSGYLHMKNIIVRPGDPVSRSTPIGKISNVGTRPNHLHFAVYTGRNEDYGLRSFDVRILKRSTPEGDFLDGHHDSTNCNEIFGWALDRARPERKSTVEIYDGNRLLATTVADKRREDLVQIGIGDGHHAFSIPTPSSLKDGQPHTVRVKIAGAPSDLKNSPQTFSQRCNPTPTARISIFDRFRRLIRGLTNSNGQGIDDEEKSEQIGIFGSDEQPINILVTPSGEDGIIGLSVSGSEGGSREVQSYQWTLNGAFLNNMPDFTHRFVPGTHSIGLTVRNDAGETDTVTATIVVTERSENKPTANILMTDNKGQQGRNNQTLLYDVSPGGSQSLNFDATQSQAGSGSITKCVWRSNGGLMGESCQLNFPFAAASHTITLTVTNSAGLTDTATALIVVTESEAPATNPRAAISMTSPDGQTGSNGSTLNYQVVPPGSINMSFNASGSQAGASNIAKYEWFSNGTLISNLPTFNFLFGVGANSNSTSHTIKLRVTNSANLTDEATATIIVGVTTSPIINSISPSTPATIVADQSVTVQGGNFQPNLQVVVTFPDGKTGRLAGTQIRYGNAAQFVMLINFNGNPGSYAIRVENPDGSRSNDFRFTVQPQTLSPTINAISPASPRATAGDQPIAISGSNFRQGMKIRVTFPNGQTSDLMGAQVSIASETSCSILINFNDIPGTYSFRAINADDKASNLFPVTVQPPVQKPAITSISPASPVATSVNQNITVTGSNFQPELVAVLTNSSGQSFPISGAQIQNLTSSQFVAVINFNGNAGGYSLKVKNPDNNESAAYGFTVQQVVQSPAISSISPSSPSATSGDQTVAIYGSNFQSGLVIPITFPNGQTTTLVGSQVRYVNSGNAEMIVNFNGNPGTYRIVVRNPDGRESSSYSFNVQAVNPSISSISPATPSRTAGDKNVTINGANFVSGAVVDVFFPDGGNTTLRGSQVQYNSSSQLVMTINFNNNGGNYRIAVRNPDGRQSSQFSFTVQ